MSVILLPRHPKYLNFDYLGSFLFIFRVLTAVAASLPLGKSRVKASARVPPLHLPFPSSPLANPCFVLLVVACCWTCVPRTAVPENLPPRALPHRRGPEHSLWRFSAPAKPGAFSARLGSKVSQLFLQLTCTCIENTANSKLFLLDYKRLYFFAACILISISRFTKMDVPAYVCVWYRACDYEMKALVSE